MQDTKVCVLIGQLLCTCVFRRYVCLHLRAVCSMLDNALALQLAGRKSTPLWWQSYTVTPCLCALSKEGKVVDRGVWGYSNCDISQVWITHCCGSQQVAESGNWGACNPAKCLCTYRWVDSSHINWLLYFVCAVWLPVCLFDSKSWLHERLLL